MHDLDVRREPYKLMEGSKTICDVYGETSNTGACVLNLCITGLLYVLLEYYGICTMAVMYYCLCVPFLCNESCMAVIQCI